MPLNIVQLDSWLQFQQWISGLGELSRDDRDQLFFRGQSKSSWNLVTTLDRMHDFSSNHKARGLRIAALIREFRRECNAMPASTTEQPTDEQVWEMLGRHHGLPVPILDWTRSPYIAAFFAFETFNESGDNASIWILNRDQLSDDKSTGVTIIDSESLIRHNRRARSQRGVFLRVEIATRRLEEEIPDALTRLDISASQRQLALNDLDEMTINARTMYGDYDAAARVAVSRLFGARSKR